MMKMPRIIIGLVLTLTALFLYGAAGMTLYKTLDAKNLAEVQAKRINDSCQSNLKAFGRVNHTIGKLIEIDLGEVHDPRATLSDIASILAYCPFHKLMESCIGTGCQIPATAIPKAYIKIESPNLD